METGTEDSRFEDPPENSRVDQVKRVRSERHNAAVRLAEAREAREATLATRLEMRQANANELRQRGLARLDILTKEHEAARNRIQEMLAEKKLDLEAAYHSARELCAEIGIAYMPGKTTDKDVLAVPLIEKAEAAKALNLPYGTGFEKKNINFLKFLLTLLCAVLSSINIGLSLHLLKTKLLVLNPLSLFTNTPAMVMGGFIALALLLTVSKIWTSVGTKIGFARPYKEFAKLEIAAVLLTAPIFLGLALFDARTLIMLSAARAALDPNAAIPLVVALLIGVIFSGLYVVGLAWSAFAEGYTVAALENIAAFIKAAENVNRKVLREKVSVQQALEAVASPDTFRETIKNLENGLDRLNEEFSHEAGELIAALPKIPTGFESHELQELADLNTGLRSEKARHDAHLLSRGNATPTTNRTASSSQNTDDR